LVVESGRVLLVQRAIEPFKGWWDIPGGFLEVGEHPEAGAIRELQEETGLYIRPTELLGLYMDTYGPEQEPTLNICYLAEVAGGEAHPQSDVTELGWFALTDLPEQIAFTWSMAAIRQLHKKFALEK
jgi:8-oxo-dGTP diphosphatase